MRVAHVVSRVVSHVVIRIGTLLIHVSHGVIVGIRALGVRAGVVWVDVRRGAAVGIREGTLALRVGRRAWRSISRNYMSIIK